MALEIINSNTHPNDDSSTEPAISDFIKEQSRTIAHADLPLSKTDSGSKLKISASRNQTYPIEEKNPPLLNEEADLSVVELYKSEE